MQSAVSGVTVGEAVQLVFCHVNFYIREESGRRRAGITGWRREEHFTFTAVVYKKSRSVFSGSFSVLQGPCVCHLVVSQVNLQGAQRTKEVVNFECCCSHMSSSTPSSAPPIMLQMCLFKQLLNC